MVRPGLQNPQMSDKDVERRRRRIHSSDEGSPKRSGSPRRHRSSKTFKNTGSLKGLHTDEYHDAGFGGHSRKNLIRVASPGGNSARIKRRGSRRRPKTPPSDNIDGGSTRMSKRDYDGLDNEKPNLRDGKLDPLYKDHAYHDDRYGDPSRRLRSAGHREKKLGSKSRSSRSSDGMGRSCRRRDGREVSFADGDGREYRDEPRSQESGGRKQNGDRLRSDDSTVAQPQDTSVTREQRVREERDRDANIPRNMQKVQKKRNKFKVDKNEDVIKVFCGTWNLHGKSAPADLSDFIPTEKYDIYVIGTEECSRSIQASVILPSKAKWVAALTAHMGSNYSKIADETLAAIHIIAFVRNELMLHIHNPETNTVATGIGDIVGNKGKRHKSSLTSTL